MPLPAVGALQDPFAGSCVHGGARRVSRTTLLLCVSVCRVRANAHGPVKFVQSETFAFHPLFLFDEGDPHGCCCKGSELRTHPASKMTLLKLILWLMLLVYDKEVFAASCRVAVCFSGHVRSFVYPVVFRSIRRNLIEAIEADGCQVDVFAYATLQDSVGRSKQVSAPSRR